MVDRKTQVTQSTDPNQPTGSQPVSQGQTDQERATKASFGGRAETGRNSAATSEQEFASNQADTSDADDPNDAQVLTREG
jgi:hypothetical protein